MAYTNETRNRGSVWNGGIVAGIIAGVVMAMFSMGYAGMMGMGFLTPLRLLAGPLYGVDALIGGAGVLLVGLMVHMMVSAMYGVIFAALVGRRTSGGAAAGWGLLYGAVVWAVMRYGVVPITDSTMNDRIPVMAGAFFFEHLLFGIVLGITPALVRRFSTQTTPAPVTRAA